MKKIVLVSEGNEIAFAKALSDLFVIKTEDQNFFSTFGSMYEVEMYSKQTFLHTNISKKTFKVYVGTAAKDYTAGSRVYEEAGMYCSVDAGNAALYVDEKVVASKNEIIMKKLGELEEEYLAKEQEFARSTNRSKTPADTRTKNSLFTKKNASATKNAYLCLAYHFYLHIFPQLTQNIL